MSDNTPKSSRNKRPLRILFVNFSYVIDVYQRKLEVAARTGDVEIGVLAPRKWYMREWNKTLTLEAHYPGIRLFPANVWFLNGVQGGHLYPLLTVLKTLIAFKPDVLQVEQEVFSLVAFEMAIFARIFKIPLVIFCWENMDKEFSFIRKFTRKFVFDTARVINPGNEDAAKLMRKWGYKGAIEIMPQLGVDLEMFQPSREPNNDRTFSVGYLGRLVPEKGIDLILNAAKQLIDVGVDFQLIICGSGPEGAALKELAIQLQITKKISWNGSYPYKDVPQAISLMDVLVLPSRTLPGIWKEQFGHVLVEAMAMGVPVIGSSSGAIPEVIGKEDQIFCENDPRGLAAILHKMITDKPWREQARQNGLDKVAEEFSHEVVANKMIAVWERICRK
ncbi:MAG TPA: glycosyltransferase [Prolixibacteraceae bacterium]